MSTDLEEHFLIARISNLPKHLERITCEFISYFKNKWPWIGLESILSGLKFIPDLGVRGTDQFEVHVAGETVLTHLIDLAVHSELLFPHASHDREQYRRTTSPKSWIALPKVFVIAFSDALKLGTVLTDLNGQDIVL